MLKIKDLLEFTSLNNSYLVAGFGGIFNMIKGIEILEEPYPNAKKYMLPGSFCLTTFWNMKDDKENRIKLVEYMGKNNCAGIGIMPKPNLDNCIDEEIINLGNQYNLPIIYVSYETAWINVISEYSIMNNYDISSVTDMDISAILSLFSEYYSEKSANLFCEKIGRILNLPIVLCTKTAYSYNMTGADTALLIARVQELITDNLEPVPVSSFVLKISRDRFAIVFLGNKAMIAASVTSDMMDTKSVSIFNKLGSDIVKLLDTDCVVNFIEKRPYIKDHFMNIPFYYAILLFDEWEELSDRNKNKYYILERNRHLKYYVVIFRDEFISSDRNVYDIYHKIISEYHPSLFIFSMQSFYYVDIKNEIQSIKQMLNSLIYIRGIISTDEMPLLYMLSCLPISSFERQVSRKIQGFFKKEDYDEDMLQTFRLYIIMRNVNNLAKMLGIHPNSVKYRINKIIQGYKDVYNRGGELPFTRMLLCLENKLIEQGGKYDY